MKYKRTHSRGTQGTGSYCKVIVITWVGLYVRMLDDLLEASTAGSVGEERTTSNALRRWAEWAPTEYGVGRGEVGPGGDSRSGQRAAAASSRRMLLAHRDKRATFLIILAKTTDGTTKSPGLYDERIQFDYYGSVECLFIGFF